MQVLIAKFHPTSKAGHGAFTVGAVFFEKGRVHVEPLDLRTVRPFDSGRLVEKLNFLVESAGEDPDRLRALRSQFWSFEEARAKE